MCEATDLTYFDFDEWVVYLFDNPTPAEGGTAWYWYERMEIGHPDRLLDYCVRLFREFASRAGDYSFAQVDQGIWMLLGRIDVGALLVNPELPLRLRLHTVRSMYSVYRDYVAGSAASEHVTCFSMWWDLLGDSFWGHQPVKGTALEPDGHAVHQAMFETLKHILALDDWACDHAALHGLSHLRHPEGASVVQAYIDRHRDFLPSESLRWVESCRDGTVM